MKVFTTIAEVPLPTVRRALVPTMGALHEGHLSLVRRAKELGQEVAVSIFVNPTQFGPNEDYLRYPRPLERDLELCEREGVDFVFAPSVEEMYSPSPAKVQVPLVTEEFEGKLRPGHFDGVATVVAKLFGILRPDVAVFGLKDLQQCAVIQKLVNDLNLRVELAFEPTLREDSGLARSSRNVYLSDEERKVSAQIYQSLRKCRLAVLEDRDAEETIQEEISSLEAVGFKVQYLEWIDRSTFHSTRTNKENGAIVFAGYLGNTRLIDNILITA